MKKIFLLPIFVTAVFVGQVSAQTYMCLYDSGDCWGGADNAPAGCNESWGWVFDGGEQGVGTYCEGGTYKQDLTTNRKNTPVPTKDDVILGCCLWASSSTYANVYTTASANDCNGGLNTWWSGIACGPAGADDKLTRPSGTPTFDGSAQTILGYCRWPTNADGSPNTAGECWPVLSASEAADCESGAEWWEGNSWTISGPGACPGTSPILKTAPGVNFVVAPYGRSLHISSAKDATISLYDMSGVKVFSGKVRAGSSVFSLEKVSSGSYYAIVQSGSDSKKVPVVLK